MSRKFSFTDPRAGDGGFPTRLAYLKPTWSGTLATCNVASGESSCAYCVPVIMFPLGSILSTINSLQTRILMASVPHPCRTAKEIYTV